MEMTALQTILESGIPEQTLVEVDIEKILQERYDSQEFDYKSKYNSEYLEQKLVELKEEQQQHRALFDGFTTMLCGEFHKGISAYQEKTTFSIDLYLNKVIENYDSFQRKLIVFAIRWFTNILIKKHYLVNLSFTPYHCSLTNTTLYLHSIEIGFV